MPIDEELTYKLIKLVEQKPDLSQRDLAKEMGISLGKVNYCVKALVDKGWIKAINFKNSQNKIAYCYVLTPKGLKEKSKITVRFLRRKTREFEKLKAEIEQLKGDHEVHQG